MAQKRKLWIVIQVQSGVPVAARAYRNPQSAAKRVTRWRKRMNLEDDEVCVFRIQVK